MEKSRHRGIVLISVLFFILVIGMIARVILINGPAMARLGGQAQEELLAQRAAEAGAVYARARFREQANWRGNLNTLTVNLPDLKVVEDQGNVIGWMINAGGQVSVFRIRFNWQDGGGGGDGMSDPSPLHFVDHPYVSVNNIQSKVDKPVPRAQSGGAWKVVNPVGPTTAPKGSAVVEVEGLCGAALSSMTGPDSPRNAGYLQRRVLRVVYAASSEPVIPDAAISAGNGLSFESPLPVYVNTIGTGTAKLRSKKGVAVVHGDGSPNALNMTGRIGHDPTIPVTANFQGTITQNSETVGDGQDFANVQWSEVPQASSDPTQAVQIPGGVYVVLADGTYLYYDMDAAGYKALVPDPTTGIRPGGLALSSDWREVRPSTNMGVSGFTVDNATKTLEVTADVRVNPSATGVQDLVLTPLQGRKLYKTETAGNYVFIPGNGGASFTWGSLHLKDSILSGQGDLAVLLNVLGENGTITGAGNAIVAAPGLAFMVNATDGSGNVLPVNQRLSLYVQKDLSLSTDMYFPGINIHIPGFGFFPGISIVIPPYDGYAPLHLEGLVYAWGNIDIFSGTPGQPTVPPMAFWGYGMGAVTIKGALVAYGANPITTSPGSAGTGHANIYATSANVTYDATKLVADPSSIPTGSLKSVMRVSFGYESD